MGQRNAFAPSENLTNRKQCRREIADVRRGKGNYRVGDFEGGKLNSAAGKGEKTQNSGQLRFLGGLKAEDQTSSQVK